MFVKKIVQMEKLNSWDDLCNELNSRFGIEVDLNGVLFLVGIRERGLTIEHFSKEEKTNLINLGSCTLYLEMGLLSLQGTDNEGWPIFHQNALAKAIPEELKQKTLQDCAIRYFQKVFTQ